MKKLKAFLKQVLKRAAEVGAPVLPPPPPKEQVIECGMCVLCVLMYVYVYVV